MGFFETINQITWPASLAIVGSVVTIVVGLLGYLRSGKMQASTKSTSPVQMQAIHDRVSSLKDKVAELDGDIKAMSARLKGIERAISEHEQRDANDFKALTNKVEKIMEIIVEMLRDEH